MKERSTPVARRVLRGHELGSGLHRCVCPRLAGLTALPPYVCHAGALCVRSWLLLSGDMRVERKYTAVSGAVAERGHVRPCALCAALHAAQPYSCYVSEWPVVSSLGPLSRLAPCLNPGGLCGRPVCPALPFLSYMHMYTYEHTYSICMHIWNVECGLWNVYICIHGVVVYVYMCLYMYSTYSRTASRSVSLFGPLAPGRFRGRAAHATRSSFSGQVMPFN